MPDIIVKDLWEKYLRGDCTGAELEQLRQCFGRPEYRSVFDELLLETFSDTSYTEEGDYPAGVMANEILLRMQEQKNTVAPVRRLAIRRWSWIAASVILLSCTGVYLWNLTGKKAVPVDVAETTAVEIPPGKEGAMLTLADGRQVVLDSLGNGVIANESGARVVLQNGNLAYEPGTPTSGEMVYNKMSTPRGRQFQITLPDDSKVWLNAESSIRFPVAFTGTNREVEITGEAYFEITGDAAKPFRVHSGDMIIDVLGTAFNLNTYPDNGVTRATLISGAIKVGTDENKPALLKPGQQWIYPVSDNGVKIVPVADMAQVVAWKNGRFSFNGNIRQIMNEVARWYNIELQYEGNMPDKELEGGFTRNKELGKVLEILEVVGGVKFVWKGKVLTISAVK